MKKYILLFILFNCVICLQAQYYYYNGEKQYLTLDKNKLCITVSSNFTEFSLTGNNLTKIKIESNDASISDLMFMHARFQENPNEVEYQQKINALRNIPDVIGVHPNFITSENIEIGMSSYFYVKLKNVSDYVILNEIAEQKNIVIVEHNRFLPLWYTLQCTKETPDNTLNIANYFFETGLFSSSVPDFLSDDLLCTNDPDFSQLWGLNNSSTGIDIHACDAWGITQGDGVIVAVLDLGIELTHIDLSANISHLSYNSESNTSPSQIFGEHGTHCAGTIGAVKDNQIQVVGVSPNCTLMSVSNSLGSNANSRIKRADGINWAWKHGADIISNSWSSSVKYDVIDEAIDSALVKGRNGKGSIIVFAAGNNSASSVSYPANSNPNIIAVGAININGAKAAFSNYGTALSVVAPGQNILSTVLNNQTATLSGTSMATPHTAGVAALILSVNPSLTNLQVKDIIESTSQKVGGYHYQTTAGRPNGTWNNEMGYGLVDAYAAVQAAACPTHVDFTNQTVISNTTVISCGDINVQNVTVTNGAKLTLDAATETIITSNFAVKLGSELEIQ